MKIALHLVLILSLIPLPLSAQERKLMNTDIIALHQAGFSAELIVTKIKNSKSEFNTSVEALAVLKRSGLPESIISAMIEATEASPALAPMPAPAPTSLKSNEIIIREGSPVEIELNDTISSDQMKEGDLIYFTVIVPIGGRSRVAIPRGAPAIARVTKAEAGKSWARGGQLAWQMQSVLAVDGTRIPLRFSSSAKGDAKNGEMTTGMVITGLLFWPAIPFWGFKKGKAASVPAGKRFMVYVHADTIINSEYTMNSGVYMQQERRIDLPGYRNGKEIPMSEILEAKNLRDLHRR